MLGAILGIGAALALLAIFGGGGSSSKVPDVKPSPPGGGGGGSPAPSPKPDEKPAPKPRIRTIDGTTPTPQHFAKKYSGDASRWKELLASNPVLTIQRVPVLINVMGDPTVQALDENGEAVLQDEIRPWEGGQALTLPTSWTEPDGARGADMPEVTMSIPAGPQAGVYKWRAGVGWIAF